MMQSRSLRGLTACALLSLASCETSPGSTPISLDSRLRLAQAASGPGDSRLRLSVLRDAAAQSPGDINILSQLAVALEQSGQFAEAAETQRAIMAREGANERRLIAIGRLLLRAGDAAGASAAYGEAVALAPRNATALGGLGLAEDMAGNRQAAQRAYRRALALAPTDWTLRSNLGMSLITSGNAREAVTVLADAEIVPNAPVTARHNLALAFAADGQLERAVRVLRMDMSQTEARARAMAEEFMAFARWLGPTSEAGQGALPPVAGPAPRGSARTARTPREATPAVAAAPAPAVVASAAPPPPLVEEDPYPGQNWLQALLRRAADGLGRRRAAAG
jgi:Flp pilus assembly protein TadD